MKTFTVHIGFVGDFKNARLRWETVQAETWKAAKEKVEATLGPNLRVVEVTEGEFGIGNSVWEIDE